MQTALSMVQHQRHCLRSNIAGKAKLLPAVHASAVAVIRLAVRVLRHLELVAHHALRVTAVWPVMQHAAGTKPVPVTGPFS